MYKDGFGINILQWLMCHKTKVNQTKQMYIYRERQTDRQTETVRNLSLDNIETELTAIEYNKFLAYTIIRPKVTRDWPPLSLYTIRT